jgi:DNA-binding CsgD family transcriptional regulator
VKSGKPLVPLARNAALPHDGRVDHALVDRELPHAHRLVVHGPAGIGKTAVATALAAREPAAVWLAPDEADRQVPFAALAELPGGEVITAGMDPFTARARAVELMRALPPALLVVDNAQWLDAASARVLAFALRKVPDLRVVVAERSRRLPTTALCGEQATHWELPPLEADGIAELLARHGSPYRWAGRVHAMSGGNPALALEFGAAIAAMDHDLTPFEALPLPDRVRQAVHERLAELDPATRDLLRLAALAGQPTVATLHRAGGTDRHLADALATDLITVDDHVAFTAGAIPATLIAAIPHGESLALHGVLARAVDDQAQRARHAALAVDEPDEEIAERAEAAAEGARSHGNRALAAELSLLAARRTPTEDTAAVLRRSVAAAVDAGRTGHVEQARHAANLVLDLSSDPADRVRARLSLVDVAGQALGDADELFAHAVADAEGDPALLAAVRLRESWKANLCDGDPVAARRIAASAVELAGDPAVRAMALTMQARMARILGLPDAESLLAKALALGLPFDGHDSPEYLAARHAVFDDRLLVARERLLGLLPAARRTGSAEDLTDVLRSLAEVEARMGRCADAGRHARQALRLTSTAGLSPGPAWYTAALAEAAGGSFDRALGYAQRAERASEEEHDRVFLSRSLHAQGLVLLVTDQPDEALVALRRVRELEERQQVGDPSILRWHADLAEALVATGSPDEAGDLLARTRCSAGGHHGVLAMLDRTLGLLVAGDEGVALLTDVAARFAKLGLPIEQGRTLLVRARVERRRRRRAAARAATDEAIELFDRVRAHPWLGIANDAARRLEPHGHAADLTEAETRLADLVGHGATNQQAAATLCVSVKTVEATLTRVYRKLGVRSRAQLAAQWAQG